MCKKCKKPCHASIKPSAIVKNDIQQQHQHKLQWIKTNGGGLFDVIEFLSRRR